MYAYATMKKLITMEMAMAMTMTIISGVLNHLERLSFWVYNGKPIDGPWIEASKAGEAQRLAAAWRRVSSQPEVRQELEDMFLDYTDLCVQHGFGASYATRYCFARPILWMKGPLQRQGRLQPLLTNNPQ